MGGGGRGAVGGACQPREWCVGGPPGRRLLVSLGRKMAPDLAPYFLTGVDPALTDTSSRVESLTGAALSKLLTDKERAFDQRFEKV